MKQMTESLGLEGRTFLIKSQVRKEYTVTPWLTCFMMWL